MKCRTCGAEIVWAATRNGKQMPIESAANGNLVVVGGVVALADMFTPPDEPRWRSHFATCPQADMHRRRP